MADFLLSTKFKRNAIFTSADTFLNHFVCR